MLDWLSRHTPYGVLTGRIFTLIAEGKTDSEEYKRCLAEQIYWMCLPIPPLAGLFHGTLIGALVGALYGLDRNSGIPAAVTAALGLLVGPVYIAFIAAVTLACIVRLDPSLPLHSRLRCRGLLVVSPLLAIPCGWYCLRAVVQRRPL